MTILTKPYTLAEMFANRDDQGYVSGNLVLAMDDLLYKDIETINDLLGQRLVGSELMMEPEYEPNGVLDGKVILRVSGDVSEVIDRELDDAPDKDLSAELLQYKYGDKTGWGEHSDFTREDWQIEVAEQATQRGYWDWVAGRIQFTATDELAATTAA